MDQKEEKTKKPFLGGWRHKLNGTEFFNAVSQTGPPPKKVPSCCMLSREVQCVETKENFSQSTRHRATQMWRYIKIKLISIYVSKLIYCFYSLIYYLIFRTDCYITSGTDTYLSIKKYETSDEMETRLNIDGHARTIQRYYRAYRIRKLIKESAKLYRKLVEDCRLLEEEKEAKIQ